MLAFSDEGIASLAIVAPMAVAVVAIVAHQWRVARVAAYNARLKQLMIERGMTADEIERVILADQARPRGGR